MRSPVCFDSAITICGPSKHGIVNYVSAEKVRRMLAYISAENSFLRSLGNRCILLLFLCVLARTGQAAGKASVLGISLDVSQGTIVVLGPLLALLLLASAKLEADGLIVSRREIFNGSKNHGLQKINPFAYVLFLTPTTAAIFLGAQFFLKIAPIKEGCDHFEPLRYFWDFSLYDSQRYIAFAILPRTCPIFILLTKPTSSFWLSAGCAWLSYRMVLGWKRYR